MLQATTATVLALFLGAGAAFAQRFHEEVSVTGSRLPAGAVARRVLVLTRAELAQLPVSTLPELLAYLLGGGVARRGVGGIQTDTALRGATFEQIAVLVDGVRVNDPQTGHFHLEIPFPLEAIERIEVLLGPGSAVHGPDAFGGVVAITTAAPAATSVALRIGQYRLAEARLAGSLGGGGWFAAERGGSDGFAPNTDWERSRGAVGWGGEEGAWRGRASFGLEEKEFGAWGFYSTRFPRQYEETSTALLTAAASRPLGPAQLSLRGAARQHRDFFVLDRPRPHWYANRHRSRSALAQATLHGEAGGLGWAVGIEGGREALASTRLGHHRRGRWGAFAELSRSWARVNVSGQLRGDRLDAVGWQLSPGAAVEWEGGGGWSAGVAGGRSFRLPSLTELHYDSPTVVGNPALEPESAWTWELVVRRQGPEVRWEGAMFQRRAHHLIDYLRGDDDIFRATNHAAQTTRGLEVAVAVPGVGRLSHLRVAATYLSSRLEADPLRSRYALAHPRWDASATALLQLPWSIRGALGVRLRQPRGTEPFAVADLRLSRQVGRGLGVEVEVANLFDRSYEEVPGVPLPGRWATLALAWRPDATP